MLLTVLQDCSLRCDDCLTEDMEDIMYSETGIGSCDECGALVRRHFTQETAIVVGKTVSLAREWAGHYLRGDVTAVGTSDPSLTGLHGLRVRRANVVVLPGSETGIYACDVERELSRSVFGADDINVAMHVNLSNFTLNTTNAAAAFQKISSMKIASGKITSGLITGTVP